MGEEYTVSRGAVTFTSPHSRLRAPSPWLGSSGSSCQVSRFPGVCLRSLPFVHGVVVVVVVDVVVAVVEVVVVVVVVDDGGSGGGSGGGRCVGCGCLQTRRGVERFSAAGPERHTRITIGVRPRI